MPPEFFTRADLLAGGGTRRSIQGAVRRGDLIHVRRDRYLPGAAHEQFARAVRVGGRLTCLSLLAMLGVFVLETGICMFMCSRTPAVSGSRAGREPGSTQPEGA